METFRYSRHPGGFDVVFLDSDSPRVQSEIGGRTLIGPRIRYALDFRKYRVVQEFLFTGAPLIGPQIRNIFARTGHFLVVNVRLLQQVFKVFAPIELVVDSARGRLKPVSVLDVFQTETVRIRGVQDIGINIYVGA